MIVTPHLDLILIISYVMQHVLDKAQTQLYWQIRKPISYHTKATNTSDRIALQHLDQTRMLSSLM